MKLKMFLVVFRLMHDNIFVCKIVKMIKHVMQYSSYKFSYWSIKKYRKHNLIFFIAVGKLNWQTSLRPRKCGNNFVTRELYNF